MAAKKYYAVKKGRETGIFGDWDTCRAAVEGYPGAEYRGFAKIEDAEEYLGMKTQKRNSVQDEAEVQKRDSVQDEAEVQKRDSVQDEAEVQKRDSVQERAEMQQEKARPEDCPPKGTLLAYVDGSYDHALKKYAFGCVFILPDGRICTEYGNGDREQSLQHRNVTGEMLGAMYAVKTAMLSGFTRIEIRYDYEGIEKWVTGAWRSKTELTQKYANAMRQWGKNIRISFTKVAAHTNVYYNELADKMAKTGLREGNGIPKIHSLFSENHESDGGEADIQTKSIFGNEVDYGTNEAE